MTKHLHSPDNCTTCTTCTAYCPVAKVTRKFRGPKMTGPAFERFRLLHQGDEDSLQYCSNCKTCDISCPSAVPVSTFNMLARAEYAKTHKPKLNEWFVAHGEFLDKMTNIIPAWMRNLGMNNPITRYVLDVIGIHRKAPLPNFASSNFKARFKKMSKPSNFKKEVVFFPGCFINVYSPQTGIDLVELLQMAGYNVIVPDDFICCGLPLISNGFVSEAEKHAKQNTDELIKWANKGIPVLAACPSCALMLKQEYGDLFPAVREKNLPAQTIVDACEFILDLIDLGELKVQLDKSTQKIYYHAPCHLRAQGIGRTGLDLAGMIPDIDVTDADAGCCGISGSYGFKKDKYEIGMAIGSQLFTTITENNADLVITECGTCQVQIKHGTGKKVLHPVSLYRQLIQK